MDTHKGKSDKLADSMLWVGIALALFFWFFTSLLQSLNNPSIHFVDHLLGADLNEIYARIVVLCLFIFFGSHVQFNINKRRKAEESLRESEDKYRNILENIREGYYEIDLNGNLIFFNDAMSDILAQSPETLKTMNIRQFTNEENGLLLSQTCDEILANKKSTKTFECEMTRPDGVKRTIEMSASLIIDFKSEPVGFRGIARDVTERKILERNLLQSYRDVKETRTGTILGLAKLAEFRDKDTGHHLERIREFSRILAQELQKNGEYQDYITTEYIEDIYLSSILHDIGKVGVPDAILLKPGRLIPEEFEVIKEHTLLGGKAISEVDSQFNTQSFLTIGKEIAFFHHEKWDGTGYPKGLIEHQIPLSARIVTLADVYDALTSKRCYKKAYSHEKAKKIIIEERGKAFDPNIVDAFLVHEQHFNKIRKKLQETHSMA